MKHKVQTITKYCVGGREFDSEQQANAHMRILALLAECNAILGSGPSDANGGTYVQHSSAAVDRFVARVGESLESPTLSHSWYQNPRGIVGRFLDDMDSPFYGCWHRISCIDSRCREWGQPYFATHPNPEAIEEMPS